MVDKEAARLTVGSAIAAQVVPGYTRKEAEKTMENKPGGSVTPWLALSFLPYLASLPSVIECDLGAVTCINLLKLSLLSGAYLSQKQKEK